MILAVDIGNSAVKASIVDGSSVHETGRLDTSIARAEDLLDGLRVLSGSHEEPPTSIVAVSVVDRWTERLEWAAGEVGLALTVVAASHIPISTALIRPDQTGPDRLLAAWAAAKLHGSPVITVDLGTATTVDAVDAEGFFLGGAILPGLRLGADALADGTARLPRLELLMPSEPIGADTMSAMRSGVVIGHIGAVRELATRMHGRMVGADDRLARTKVIMTGGLCEADWAEAAWRSAAGPGLPAIADELDPELVLKGLGLLAEHMATHPGTGVSS